MDADEETTPDGETGESVDVAPGGVSRAWWRLSLPVVGALVGVGAVLGSGIAFAAIRLSADDVAGQSVTSPNATPTATKGGQTNPSGSPTLFGDSDDGSPAATPTADCCDTVPALASTSHVDEATAIRMGEALTAASPMWSPTRNEVAAIVEVGADPAWDGQRVELVVIDAQTGQSRALESNSDFSSARQISWSPDGSRVALLSREETDRLYVFSRDGTFLGRWAASTNYPPKPEDGRSYAVILGFDWSPDGTTIAISQAPRNDASHVAAGAMVAFFDVVNDVDRGDNYFEGAYPSYSPDGTRIALLHDDGDDDTYGVWVASVADGALAQLSPEYSFSLFDGYPAARDTRLTPSWSADGTRVAFLSPEATTASNLPASVLYKRVTATFVAGATGGSLARVSDCRSSAPEWLPDGDLLACSTVFDGTTLAKTTRTTNGVAWYGTLATRGSVPAGWNSTLAFASSDGRYSLVYAIGPSRDVGAWYIIANDADS